MTFGTTLVYKFELDKFDCIYSTLRVRIVGLTGQ